MSPEMLRRMINRAMASERPPFRAVLTAINTKTPITLIQADGVAGEQLQDNELMQHYGYTSAPPAGTQAVVIPLGGKTAHGIIIATEHTSYRLKALKTGEVAIYDDLGQSVHLTRTGIVINGGGLPVTIKNTPSVTADTPQFHMTGDLTVDGDIHAQKNVLVAVNLTAQGDIADHGNKTMTAMRTAYNGHHNGSGTTAPDAQM
ncbi:MAG: phage baseplate assembly protein V [Undibacterium sp.]|uniref:phage baseplate assembly protein V n=1 Tax=Undibacterium sp. TaxID=1914977 RepID=UPI002721D34A|nr:phage baseplate assembly protein V [Undibacterium sp.]MDO8654184.1 phage baseplate assembly protein V [Undibacterium sp.]